MEACLIGLGQTEAMAKSMTAPFHELHGLRNMLHGHAAVEKAEQMGKLAIRTHGTLRDHFLDLTARCETSLGQIIQSFGIARADDLRVVAS